MPKPYHLKQPSIIARQLKKLKPNPHFTISQKNEDSLDEFLIYLHPQGGYYKEQKHILEFKTVYGRGENMKYFPRDPPNVKFITNIYHTNISSKGTICLDILKESDKWSSQYNIETVIISILALLDDPNTSSPYNCDASKDWSNCVKKYKKEISENKISGKEILEIKENIFKSYVEKSNKYAEKNNIKKWSKYFPEI